MISTEYLLVLCVLVGVGKGDVTTTQAMSDSCMSVELDTDNCICLSRETYLALLWMERVWVSLKRYALHVNICRNLSKNLCRIVVCASSEYLTTGPSSTIAYSGRGTLV